jgi:hypothetical protein
MTDRIRERLKNRGERFTRETAEAQLKSIGLTLSADWSPRRGASAATDEPDSAQPVPRRAAQS